MARRKGRETTREVDAINRVLDAEASMRKAIERCEAEAHARVEAARAQARQIRRRTTQRIVLLHRAQIEKTEAYVDALRREAESRATEVELDTRARSALIRAAERLAKELTERSDG